MRAHQDPGARCGTCESLIHGCPDCPMSEREEQAHRRGYLAALAEAEDEFKRVALQHPCRCPARDGFLVEPRCDSCITRKACADATMDAIASLRAKGAGDAE